MKYYSSFLHAAMFGALIIVSACGGGDGDKAKEDKLKPKVVQAEKVNLELTINATGNNMTEMAYDQQEIKVPANSTVKVNLVNKGTDPTMLHNIVFIQFGLAKEVAADGMPFKENSYVNPTDGRVIAHSKMAAPGETVTVEFEAPAAGTYQFICTYPGHWMKMQGKLIVE